MDCKNSCSLVSVCVSLPLCARVSHGPGVPVALPVASRLPAAAAPTARGGGLRRVAGVGGLARVGVGVGVGVLGGGVGLGGVLGLVAGALVGARPGAAAAAAARDSSQANVISQTASQTV